MHKHCNTGGRRLIWVNNVVLPVHPCLGANISVTAHLRPSQKLSASLLTPWVAVEKVDIHDHVLYAATACMQCPTVMMARLRGSMFLYWSSAFSNYTMAVGLLLVY